MTLTDAVAGDDATISAEAVTWSMDGVSIEFDGTTFTAPTEDVLTGSFTFCTLKGTYNGKVIVQKALWLYKPSEHTFLNASGDEWGGVYYGFKHIAETDDTPETLDVCFVQKGREDACWSTDELPADSETVDFNDITSSGRCPYMPESNE